MRPKWLEWVDFFSFKIYDWVGHYPFQYFFPFRYINEWGLQTNDISVSHISTSSYSFCITKTTSSTTEKTHIPQKLRTPLSKNVVPIVRIRQFQQWTGFGHTTSVVIGMKLIDTNSRIPKFYTLGIYSIWSCGF
jgi:hypothetical protein